MRLLTTEDAALACGVDPATIRQWGVRGKLTRHGTPQRAMWRVDELAALVRQRNPRHARAV
jgi:hypothetical protein